MTRYQRAKRTVLLRGCAIAVIALVFLMLLSALADRVTQ
jgi:hypothetical protein